MWNGVRKMILERHRFYVEQVRNRLLGQFDDIEGEAEIVEAGVWTAQQERPYHPDIDESDIAEWAQDAGLAHYFQLTELKKQVLLGSIAGMFHQWDKELRQFMEKELHHYYNNDAITKKLWPAKTVDLFDLLKQFGWDAAACDFYPHIDACNLIVNVYKHGKGSSLTQLNAKYPKYLPDPVPSGGAFWRGADFLDYSWLAVDNEGFDLFAKAFDGFWTAMPERLYLSDAAK